MRYVFVYGTLRAGEVNDIGQAAARSALATPTLIGEASVRGRLFDFGDYPGLVPDNGGVHVKGDVYQIDERLVPVLDQIEEVYPGEAGLFMQHEVTVHVDGKAISCIYYPVQRDAVRGLPEIGSGDWVAYRRARK
ncbi:gamma-glutamylcyclotransferase family protein [Paraburkholderia solisilvae]|uniref:Gamma-glutamylcyclotransferase YkqA n=1 Tax=Paraburkholderia solisilvae TaxID=624376 RepID=A0A6J5EIU5_9BURK|nr:gamma-glutamylcyclotransferase family protein [Paraburkholderia solisilvae]CAB3765677.1 Putative gamma-glutamylcyclotransferase YkqA [Paraburkholderia solisilvae]